jgi:replication-associated recombination protein RarA
LLNKINAKRLINKCIRLNKGNTDLLEKRINDLLTAKGCCYAVFTGAPGCGKSTLARAIKQKGFLNLPKDRQLVIDDLRGPDNKKYSRKELSSLIDTIKDRVLLLFDYKAALYIKKADFCLILDIDEEERMNNLKKRSAWGFKKYKSRFYRTPPVPLYYNKNNTFICSGNILYTFGFEN